MTITAFEIDGEQDMCPMWVEQYGCDTMWSDVCDEDFPGPQGNNARVVDACPDLCIGEEDAPLLLCLLALA